ncbi:CAR1 transcription factor [Lucilia cuprina]|uniref:CAR1 transcription factor n=1 Tax=Lucilia cuprina TaxID=7375 RepID=UPI001F065EAD|nr:CAR1 transcription factor [Lucilia cuprina]
MFPQSELDNYKLQVELLQEKLQRSEISRQQLEHKLDKILQKREEHDKSVRSKTRQKYQQFLEEQQRRNERNKQLVQMLERIEQQTEIMNARSERLKMMKLQYEMYFAKLVHSQTRRCIQNSVTPMMATTSGQPVVSAVQPVVMDDYNFARNQELSAKAAAPLVNNSYQNYAAPLVNSEKEQILRTQPDNINLGTMDMPTLANFVANERNNYMDFRNLNTVPSIPTQQSYQYPVKYEQPNGNNIQLPMQNNNYNRMESPVSSATSPIVNSRRTLSSVTNLLPNDKLNADLKEPSNLSTTTTSSTFEEIPNVSMRPQISNQNLRELPNNVAIDEKSNHLMNNNVIRQVNENVQPLENKTQAINETTLRPINSKDDNSFKAPELNNQSNKSPALNEVNNFETVVDNPTTSIQLEPTKPIDEPSPTSYNTNNVNSQPEPMTQTTITKESFLATSNTESNSSTTPVSIENIENAIYGELLSPLETEEVPISENSNVDPKLLENLVTQEENIETNNIPLEEIILNKVKALDNNDTTAANFPENEQSANTQNYEQNLTYDEYNNAQQQQPKVTETTAADYNNYENVDNTAIVDSQQQQQYDYSNYDPTQYSYPGYIYDETTGEYKPDPNATAEQYATDQQYNTEGYDQQYQQQEVYDYNQTYAEDPTTSAPASAENTAYNNYDATALQENSSNNITSDTNAEQQQSLTEPEAIAVQPEISTEEIPQQTSTNKVNKPTSILSSTDKNNNTQKKKKRVNFVDSRETDESALVEKAAVSKAENTAGASSESDFDFSSSTDAEPKAT